MKTKFLTILLIISIFILAGCSSTNTKSTTKSCAKCGDVATSTISGTAQSLTSQGINLNKCKEITSGIYSAPICDDCMGPVVDLSPIM